jgi:hypothetical protein
MPQLTRGRARQAERLAALEAERGYGVPADLLHRPAAGAPRHGRWGGTLSISFHALYISFVVPYV